MLNLSRVLFFPLFHTKSIPGTPSIVCIPVLHPQSLVTIPSTRLARCKPTLPLPSPAVMSAGTLLAPPPSPLSTVQINLYGFDSSTALDGSSGFRRLIRPCDGLWLLGDSVPAWLLSALLGEGDFVIFCGGGWAALISLSPCFCVLALSDSVPSAASLRFLSCSFSLRPSVSPFCRVHDLDLRFGHLV